MTVTHLSKVQIFPVQLFVWVVLERPQRTHCDCVYADSNSVYPTMKKEYDDELVRLCPNLYGDRNADMQSTCMCWGFPEDGWYELIKSLSLRLEEMILQMPEEKRGEYRASQVKEKFGTLRFYMSSSTLAMEELIEQAEGLSAEICETCGHPGSMRGKNWYYVACDEHTKPQDLSLL